MSGERKARPATPEELDSLLVEAFQAYREGLLRRPPPDRLGPQPDFNALMFLGTLGWMSPEDRLLTRRLNHTCGSLLTAARQGDLDAAESHRERAQALFDASRESPLRTRLLSRSTYLSASAYLLFLRGDPEGARQSLRSSMDADLELEDRGLEIMQMHRIQQGHNLARMDLRGGRRERGVRLVGELVAYMEGRGVAPSHHREWRPKAMRSVPRYQLRGMIRQVVGETASFVTTGPDPRGEWRLFIDACRMGHDPAVSFFPQVDLGLSAQTARLAGDAPAYLKGLRGFFAHGIRDCHELYYALVVDFAAFCSRDGSRVALQALEILRRDSAKWKGISPHVLAVFQEQAACQRVA